MSDDQQPQAPESGFGPGYGQPYGYGPQPYDYPAQHYGHAPAADPYAAGSYTYPGAPVPPPYYGAPPAPPTPGKSGRNWTLIAGTAAVAAALVIGVGVATHHTDTTNGTALDGTQANPGISNGGSSTGGGSTDPFGSGGSLTTPGSGSSGTGGTGGTSGSGSSTGTASTASTKQQVGVVDIDTIIGYNEGEAAGTGLVLDSSGEILTNNHVIDEATTIKVTIVSTGKTYSATVVGTAPTLDIAVIKLAGASGLTTANFGNSSSVKVGDSVTGVGNAGGKGGTPSAAAGTVTALNQTITASDESGTSSEQLTGVIATNAPIQAGDSGGPLYNSSDKVIGIDTAASTSRQQSAGFAIPINNALSIASQIESGVQTSSIHIGSPAALGVGLSIDGTLTLEQVFPGGGAANAGLVAGDTITAVNGTKVATQAKLKTLVTARKPGDKLSVTYLDQTGTSHTVTVTLSNGPAD